MITKMKKMTFLVARGGYEGLLDRLRELGVLHIDVKGDLEGGDTAMDGRMALLARYDTTIRQLQDIKGGDPSVYANETDPLLLLDKVDTINRQSLQTMQRNAQLSREISQYEPWGDFEPENVSRLADAGYEVRLYSTPVQKWDDEWVSQYNAQIISSDDLKVFFVTVTKKGETPDLDADYVHMPETSLTKMKAELSETVSELSHQDLELSHLAAGGMELLNHGKSELMGEIEYAKLLAHKSVFAQGRVCMVQGWVPAYLAEWVVSALDEKGLYINVENPTPEDRDIPILLKNNRFVKLFEPFTRLYMLPEYRELDLTMFIAPFFMLFFALCFGDMGYGLLMLLALPLFRMLFHLVDESFSDGIIKLLGISTVVVGTLTGSFFGFQLYDINVPFIQAAKEFLYQDQMKLLYLSFAVGGVHIVVSMVLKSINMTIQFGLKYAVSTIGWIVVIVAGAVAYFTGATGTLLFKVVAAVAAAAIFLFNAPDKSPFKSVGNLLLNLGSGLWDTYNMATGLLGDILSYVRLFALGMSGSVLATVFDDLALGVFDSSSLLKSVLTGLGCVLIFLFGHAINIFMSFLGSMIHPMRLIFVEFFKNSSYTGGGGEYRPFK